MTQPADQVFRSLVERAADVILLLDGDVATSEQQAEIYVLHPRRGLVATNIRRATVEVEDYPRMAVYLRDVTERVREEERLGQFAVIFDAISEGVIITGPDSVIVAVNRAFTEITGYAHEEVVGRTPEFLYQDSEFYGEIRRVLERQGFWDGELHKCRSNGEVYLEELSINAVCRDNGELIYYVGVCTDITGVKNLRHRADHDPLTELYNRYAFQQHLEEEIRRVDDALYQAKACGRNCVAQSKREIPETAGSGPGSDHGKKGR